MVEVYSLFIFSILLVFIYQEDLFYLLCTLI